MHLRQAIVFFYSLRLQVLVANAVLRATRRVFKRPHQQQLRIGAGSSKSGALSVSQGNVLVQEGQPGIAYAHATKAGQRKELVYFLIFSHDSPAMTVEIGASGTEIEAETYHTINSFGNECTAKYRVALSAGGEVVKESITVGKKSYDPDETKLFMIDMKATPPTITAIAHEVTGENLSFDFLRRLRTANSAIDKFCRRVSLHEDDNS